jgi:hypothetical protein
VIEAGIEQVAAATPQRRVDPWRCAVRRPGPGRAALPGRTLGERRRPGVNDARFEGPASLERRGQRDAQLTFWIGVGGRRNPLPVDVNLGDGELGEEIEDERLDPCVGLQAQRRRGLDPLPVGQHLHRQIEVFEGERQLLGRHRPAHLARLGGDELGVVGVGHRRRDLPLRMRREHRRRHPDYGPNRRAHRLCSLRRDDRRGRP